MISHFYTTLPLVIFCFAFIGCERQSKDVAVPRLTVRMNHQSAKFFDCDNWASTRIAIADHISRSKFGDVGDSCEIKLGRTTPELDHAFRDVAKTVVFRIEENKFEDLPKPALVRYFNGRGRGEPRVSLNSAAQARKELLGQIDNDFKAMTGLLDRRFHN